MRLDLTNNTLSGRLQNVAVISGLHSHSETISLLDRHEFVGHLTIEQLVAIATGAVDIKQLAHDELVSRGVAI